MLTWIVLSLTARVWTHHVNRVILAAYENGKIDSRALHVLAQQFDCTQKKYWWMTPGGEVNAQTWPQQHGPCTENAVK